MHVLIPVLFVVMMLSVGVAAIAHTVWCVVQLLTYRNAERLIDELERDE